MRITKKLLIHIMILTMTLTFLSGCVIKTASQRHYEESIRIAQEVSDKAGKNPSMEKILTTYMEVVYQGEELHRITKEEFSKTTGLSSCPDDGKYMPEEAYTKLRKAYGQKSYLITDIGQQDWTMKKVQSPKLFPTQTLIFIGEGKESTTADAYVSLSDFGNLTNVTEFTEKGGNSQFITNKTSQFIMLNRDEVPYYHSNASENVQNIWSTYSQVRFQI